MSKVREALAAMKRYASEQIIKHLGAPWECCCRLCPMARGVLQKISDAEEELDAVAVLTFDDLRKANIARLPLFKNRKGEPAHSKPDGSDWCLAQWANAVCGELGEAANIIKKIDRGEISLEEAKNDVANELADVQTYLDILAFRAGIDLGQATISKWNAVSVRVGCDVRIETKAPAPTSPDVETSSGVEEAVRLLRNISRACPGSDDLFAVVEKAIRNISPPKPEPSVKAQEVIDVLKPLVHKSDGPTTTWVGGIVTRATDMLRNI